jgi:hypothetical protein
MNDFPKKLGILEKWHGFTSQCNLLDIYLYVSSGKGRKQKCLFSTAYSRNKKTAEFPISAIGNSKVCARELYPASRKSEKK